MKTDNKHLHQVLQRTMLEAERSKLLLLLLFLLLPHNSQADDGCMPGILWAMGMPIGNVATSAVAKPFAKTTANGAVAPIALPVAVSDGNIGGTKRAITRPSVMSGRQLSAPLHHCSATAVHWRRPQSKSKLWVLQ